jgi:hypothetical protein
VLVLVVLVLAGAGAGMDRGGPRTSSVSRHAVIGQGHGAWVDATARTWRAGESMGARGRCFSFLVLRRTGELDLHLPSCIPCWKSIIVAGAMSITCM